MSNTPTVGVNLVADNKQAAQSINSLKDIAKQASDSILGSFGDVGQSLASLVTSPTTIATLLGGVAIAGTKMAMDIEHAGRRIEAVFPGISDAAKPLSNEFGVAQTNILNLFDTIEKNGEASREGLQTTARAVLELNQALAGTTENLPALADGMDQVLDLFHLSGTEAENVAAKLFAISKGRVPIEELVDAFRGSALTIREHNISLDLAAAGLTKLLEAGLPAKKAAAELQKEIAKGEESFRAFVGPVEDATTQLAAFQERVRLLGETSATTNARLRTEFSNALVDLGNLILPTVNKNLSNTLTLLDQFTGRAGAFEDLDTIGDIAQKYTNNRERITMRDRNVAGRRVLDLDKQLRDGDISFGELSSGQLVDLQRNLETLGRVISDPTMEAARLRLLEQVKVLTAPAPAQSHDNPVTKTAEEILEAAQKHRQALLFLADAGHLPAAGLKELLDADRDLERQLQDTNLTLERRAELFKEHQAVEGAISKAIPAPEARVVGPSQPAQLQLRDTSNLQILPDEAPAPLTPTEGPSPFTSGLADSLEPLQRFSEALLEAGGFSQDLQNTLGEMAGNTLVNLSDGFANAFEAIGQGKNVFKSLADAAKKSIAQSAAFAGREQFAKAAAKLAEGLFGGGPAAFASAAKHVVAGGLFMGIAGGVGGSGGTGGGGTSAYTRQRDFGTNGDTADVKQGEATIVINGGLLDMSDPNQAQALADAISKLSNRRVITVGA